MRSCLQKFTQLFFLLWLVVGSQPQAADVSDPFKSFKNDSFFNESSSDDLENAFDQKVDNMFATVKNAQKSVENTQLGPMGRYVLGRQLAARVLGAYNLIDENDSRVEYLRQVVSSIMLASRLSTTYIEPVVILLDAPDSINAFAAPGGFIFVTTGMLSFLENEDELAFVLAHEVAHIELDHGLNAIKQNEGAKIFKEAAGDELSDELFSSFLGFAENGYSEALEGEADFRGAEIASSLGYDISQGIQMIGRLEAITSHKHATGYPENRKKILEEGVKGSKISAKFIAIRQQRYNTKINK